MSEGYSLLKLKLTCMCTDVISDGRL